MSVNMFIIPGTLGFLKPFGRNYFRVSIFESHLLQKIYSVKIHSDHWLSTSTGIMLVIITTIIITYSPR